VDDDRRAAGFVDGQVIGDEGRAWPLAVLDLDGHRFLGPAGLQFPASPPAVPGPPQAGLETLCEEGEHVEDRGLAASVRTQQHGYRREILELDIAECAEVRDLEVLDSQ